MADSGWFAGNHGPEGVYASLKGSMLAPNIAGPWTGGVPSMVQVDTSYQSGSGWASNTIVNTGMTGGGGTMAR